MMSRTRRPYLWSATIILLAAAFFRLWDLGSIPPGMLVEELHNVQLADRMRGGDVMLVYDDVTPGREGLYYGLLAVTATFFGRGLILWRLPSVWLSLVGLCITFSFIRRLLNGRVALVAMAYIAVTFWPIWMGRAIMHVTLMPLATAALGYTLVRAFQASEAQEAGLWFTAAGIELGLAQYLHVSAWGLALVMLGFVFYLALTHRRVLGERWLNLIFAGAIAGIIFVPMLVLTVTNPGVRTLVPLAEQGDLLQDIPERMGRSLAGLTLRGDSSPNRNIPFRPITDPLTAILFVTGVGVALAKWRRATYMILPIWLVLGLVPAALVPDAPHYEQMALVLPVIFAFPALALEEVRDVLAKGRYTWAAPGMLALLLVGGNALWTARDVFVRWSQGGDVRFNYQSDIASLARYLDVEGPAAPVGLCVLPISTTDDPFALQSDGLLDYFMHRSTLPIRKFDCRHSLVLADGGVPQRLIFVRGQYYDDLPGPLLAWMQSSEDENIPGVPPGVVRRVDNEEQLGTFLRETIRTASVSWPPEASGGSGSASLPATFTENLQLEAYEVRDSTLLPGEVPEIMTYWRVTGSTLQELQLQLQMQEGPGRLVALGESWGADLSTIHPEDVILQYNILLPREEGPLDSGEYRLAAAMMVPGAEVRLRVLDGGRPRSDRLLLQGLTVVD